MPMRRFVHDGIEWDVEPAGGSSDGAGLQRLGVWFTNTQTGERIRGSVNPAFVRPDQMSDEQLADALRDPLTRYYTLTDEEKRKIGKAFRWAGAAIIHGNEIGVIHARLDDFIAVYRGRLTPLIEQFSIANNHREWLERVADGLRHEIGPDFYVPYDLPFDPDRDL